MKRAKSISAYLEQRLGAPAGDGAERLYWCPSCIDEIGSESRHRKLHVNVVKGMGHCFRCEFAFKTLSRLFRFLNDGKITLEETALLRDESFSVTGNVEREVRSKLRKKRRPSSFLLPVMLPYEAESVAGSNSIGSRTAMLYLRSRGVPDAYVKRFDIHYCEGGDYHNYLVFPVHQDEEQVYFTSRWVGTGRRMKSKNPPKDESGSTVSKSTCLLGYDNCVGAKQVALVEGPFDMMAFPHALGVMGKVLSTAQARLIERLVDRGLEEVVIALDPDASHQAHRAFEALTARVPRVSNLALPRGLDPWDARERLSALLVGRGSPTVLAQAAGLFRDGGSRRYWRKTRGR